MGVPEFPPIKSFPVSSSATGYPSADGFTGTATDTESPLITTTGIIVVGVLVEAGGTGAGVLTIGDHSGTPSYTLAIPTSGLVWLPFGPTGALMPGAWVGLRGALTGTGQKVRIFYELTG